MHAEVCCVRLLICSSEKETLYYANFNSNFIIYTFLESCLIEIFERAFFGQILQK